MKEIRKKAHHRYEVDNWRPEGEKITSVENLKLIQESIEEKGTIFIKHWFLRGSSSPDSFLFSDFDEFLTYIEEKVSGGDAIDIWIIHDIINIENSLTGGKVPDKDGCIPEKGAY